MKKLDNSELVYINKIVNDINLLAVKHLYVVAGRGISKTTEILAGELKRTVYELPQSTLGLVANTYTNLMSNVVPAMIQGLERKGMKDDFHFVVDKEPPAHFKRPHHKTFRYQHTISFFNGTKVMLVSGDRPDTVAGLSFAGYFIDEAKKVKGKTIDHIAPALRDNPLFYHNNPYFQRIIAVSDMPDISRGDEYDWILEQQKFVDPHKLELIRDCAMVLNDILIDLLKKGISHREIQDLNDTLRINPKAKINPIFYNYRKYHNYISELRRDSMNFIIASSYANADILGRDFFKYVLKQIGIHDFKKSILSIKPDTAEKKFFPTFNPDKHLFSDGYNYEYFDQFSIGKEDKVIYSSEGLTYLKKHDKITIALDFGLMCSLVASVKKNNQIIVLKELYTLVDNENPQYIPQLAQKFVAFFKSHQNKIIDCFYDRDGNKYGIFGKAEQFKKEVEACDSSFFVHLLSKEKGNVTHRYAYDLCYNIFEETNPKYPKVRIDEYNCENLIRSIRLSPAKNNPDGSVAMDKSSEKKMPIHKQPSETTQLASAFVYLLDGFCSKIHHQRHSTMPDPTVC